MKRGTFKISTGMYRFRGNTVVVKVYVRNNNKIIYTKQSLIQQTISPFAEVIKSVVSNDPEASTINYYYSLFEQEVKQLAETSTPETIANDIQAIATTPVFAGFFAFNKVKEKKVEKQPKPKQQKQPKPKQQKQPKPKQQKQPKREKQPKKQVMKLGTFETRTILVRYGNNGAVTVRAFARNNNKMIFTKSVTIQQTLTPEAEVEKSVVYNDPEASTINYYYSLFEQEVKQLAETSTPETIADDIEGLFEAPVFSNFFINNRRRLNKRDIETDVRIVRDFDPYAFNDDFKGKAHVLHTIYTNKFGEPLCIKENFRRAVKNGSYSGSEQRYYYSITPYLDDIESWQQIQSDEELKQRMEIYNNDRLIDFALDDKPTEEKEYAPYISIDQWEVMMDDYIKKLKIKWQQEEKQTAEK